MRTVRIYCQWFCLLAIVVGCNGSSVQPQHASSQPPPAPATATSAQPPIVQPPIPQSTAIAKPIVYSIGDGSRTGTVGFGNLKGSFIAANQFTAKPGGEVIVAIDVSYANAAVGTPVQLLLFRDRDNAITPDNPVLIVSVPSSVTYLAENAFCHTAIPPTRVTGNFFVGVFVGARPSGGQYPINTDKTDPKYRTFWAWFSTDIGPIDSGKLSKVRYDRSILPGSGKNLAVDSYSFGLKAGNPMIGAEGAKAETQTEKKPKTDESSYKPPPVKLKSSAESPAAPKKSAEPGTTRKSGASKPDREKQATQQEISADTRLDCDNLNVGDTGRIDFLEIAKIIDDQSCIVLPLAPVQHDTRNSYGMQTHISFSLRPQLPVLLKGWPTAGKVTGQRERLGETVFRVTGTQDLKNNEGNAIRVHVLEFVNKPSK